MDDHHLLEERSLFITITPPWWATFWAGILLPCSDRFSFLRISPKGAFIKVSGVRISCAVLIKNRIFILNYDQNIFSLDVSSINYDNPSNIVYSWKLEGFYDEWGSVTVSASSMAPSPHPKINFLSRVCTPAAWLKWIVSVQ